MKKIILWSSVVIVIAGLGVGVFFLFFHHPPQIITLPDGTKLTLLGVEYGKHHKYPTVKLPSGTRRTSGGGPSSFDTPEDTLVIWILQEHKPNQWPSYETLVYDRAETACVGNWAGGYNNQIRQGMEIAAVQLNAFPRRDRKFYLRFMTYGQRGQQVSKEQFVISNPARGSFSKWTPMSLPITQSEGDLDVQLTRLVYGARGFNSGNRTPNDAMNKAVIAGFHTEQKGVTVTNWQPVRIGTSDATGNHVENNSWSSSRDANGDATMTYQWGLWPDEPAWKLRVEMSRTSGFSDDEVWAVTNLTVQPGSQNEMWNYNSRRKTNSFFAETTLNGINLKIFPALQFTNQNNGSQRQGGFRIMADPDPTQDGYRLTTVQVTDENGRDLQTWNGGSGGGNYVFQVPNIRNTKNLNVTVALHKSRFVEFTAKPSKEAGKDGK